MSRSGKAHLLLVLVTFAWGATFVQIKDALRDITPLLFNAVRMILAAACLVLIYRKHLHFSRGVLGAGLLLGALLWVGYSFQTTGLMYTSPSKAAFLTGLAVILVPVYLALIWRRHINRWTTVGVVAAFVGLYLMTVPAARGDGLFSGINRGDLLTLGCAVAFAFQIIFMGRAMRVHRFEQIATLQAMFAAALMVLSLPVLEHPHVTWSWRVIAAIVVTAVFCTAAAFTIQAWAQQFTPPTHTALIFMLEPVFAWATAYAVLGEKLGLRAGMGAFLIIGGILLSELKGSASQPTTELGDMAAEAREA